MDKRNFIEHSCDKYTGVTGNKKFSVSDGFSIDNTELFEHSGLISEIK